jgi:alpha-amylase
MSFRRSSAILVAVSVLLAACGGPGPSPGIHTSASPSASASSGLDGPPSATPGASSSAAPAVCGTAPALDDVGWWTDAVVYEVFVRSFADSDGDGIGDLRGLTDRLDYLNDGDPATSTDLGVTALWLMPVAASPSYHGYDVVDYLTIEPDYGTNEDFRQLVTEAEARGIRIIVDLVLNHTSVEHPWFLEAQEAGSAREDWYVWSDERPSVAGPAGRPVWHRAGDRWYYGYFWEGMPDLDVANPDVRGELRSIAEQWLTEMGVAGFRLDAARHLIEDGAELENTPETMVWLQDFRDHVHEVRPDALVLGEVWDATSVSSSYVRDGALDLAFEFGLAGALLQAARNGDAGSLRIIQDEVTAAYPAGGYAPFLTNHDQDRVFDVVGRDEAAARQAATLLLTAAGTPFLYYGEEVGLRGRKPDERIRTPMPWTGEAPGFGFTTADTPWQPMAEEVDVRNVAAMDGDADSLLTHYRSLLALRAAEPALRDGRLPVIPVAASDRSVYAMLRHDPVTGEAVVVVSNLGDEAATDVALSLDAGPLCGAVGTGILFRAGVPTAGSGAAPDPVVVSPTGGFDAWAIGDLGPREDLILELIPAS